MSGSNVNVPGYGGLNWQNPVASFVDLPTVGNLQGDLRVTLDTVKIYQWTGQVWSLFPQGGGSTVTDVNLTEVGGAGIALGQTTMSQSIPVAIASDQSPIQVTGTVTGNSNINGLSAFKSTQQTVGTSVVQLTPTPLASRSSLVIKVATLSDADAVYIGETSSVTTSTGFILYNNDITSLDLTASGVIYAISNAPGQTVYLMELAE